MAFTISFTGNDMTDVQRQINEFLGAPKAPTKLATPKEEWVEPPKVTPVVSDVIELEETEVATADEPEPLTYEDVRKEVLRLSVAKGKDAVLELFAKYGAQKKADEIDPAKWPSVITDIQTILGE